MKGLTDKYETYELHIPNMFQGTINKVYYLTVITILSLIVIHYEFFMRPFFEASQNIQNMGKV
jgi:hypothetical protein